MLDRLFSIRALFTLSALFIVYATTMPWNFSPPPLWSSVQWTPFPEDGRGRVAGIPDIVQNVVLFLPFGFLGWFAIRRVVAVTLLGCALSASVEFLQTMSPTRTSSVRDLCTNTAGAFAGALLALVLADPVERKVVPWLRGLLRSQPGVLSLLALLAAVVWNALAPFYPTLDVGAFKEQVKGFLANPWGEKPWPFLGFDVVLYAGLAVVWLRELRTGIALCLLAGALEFAQFLFQGHSPALQDVTAAWCGIAIGGFVVRRTGPGPARQADELPRRFPGLCYGFALAIPALRALEPFRFGAWSPPGPRAFVPFASIFGNITLWTVANFFTIIATYLPLAHVQLMRGRRVRGVACACFGVALVLETLQIPIEGRTFDVTEALLAAVAALAAARAHQLVRPRAESGRSRYARNSRT